MSKKVKCQSSSAKSVCLKDILDAFNSSIKEEHAWALCYQCIKFFIDCLSANRSGCYVVSEVHHVFLQTDGNIHPNTLFSKDGDRKPMSSVEELISGLGCVIYNTLDRGSQNGEERAISQDLEELISDMVSEERSVNEPQHHETDDEGIERDSEEGEFDQACSKPHSSITPQEVLRRCERHLGKFFNNVNQLYEYNPKH